MLQFNLRGLCVIIDLITYVCNAVPTCNIPMSEKNVFFIVIIICSPLLTAMAVLCFWLLQLSSI